MYKIVQTTEKGKAQLCVVPEGWENSGILYWPKNKADRLIKDAKSTPEDNWFEMQCSVKRTHLINFEVAEEELDNMLLCEDTDDCELENRISKKRQRINLLPKPTYKIDFNSEAQSCLKSSTAITSKQDKDKISDKTLCDEADDCEPASIQIKKRARVNLPKTTLAQSCIKTSTVTSTPATFVSVEDVGLPLQHIQQPKNLLNPPYEIIIDSIPYQGDVEIEDLSGKISSNSGNLEKILMNQEEIIRNQRVILNELSSHSVILEELFKKLERNDNVLSVNNLAQKVDSIVHDFNPIDSLHDINELESKLKNVDTMKMLVEKLSFICGKSGKENGFNTCYTIVDNLFTRKFMTLCSWAGGSRGDMEKIPFKIYKNVIHFFFQLIKLADNDFTLENCEQFFKNILKNSTRRNELKTFTRSSKCKNRPKKLTYKTKTSELVETNDGSQASTSMIEINANKEITAGEESADSSE